MEFNVGPEHLAVVFAIILVAGRLKRLVRKDLVPFLALVLGWLGAVPLIIWQERTVPSWGVLLSGMFIEGTILALVAMGGYDTAVKKTGLRRWL
ncbi:MAG: hypothetical protein ACM3ZU_07875 [Bacteroidota bacterium]